MGRTQCFCLLQLVCLLVLLAFTALVALTWSFFWYFSSLRVTRYGAYILPVPLTYLTQTYIFLMLRNLRAPRHQPVLKALSKLFDSSHRRRVELLIVVLFHLFLVTGDRYSLDWLVPLLSVFVQVVDERLLFAVQMLTHGASSHGALNSRGSSNSATEWKLLVRWAFCEFLLLIKQGRWKEALSAVRLLNSESYLFISILKFNNFLDLLRHRLWVPGAGDLIRRPTSDLIFRIVLLQTNSFQSLIKTCSTLFRSEMLLILLHVLLCLLECALVALLLFFEWALSLIQRYRLRWILCVLFVRLALFATSADFCICGYVVCVCWTLMFMLKFPVRPTLGRHRRSLLWALPAAVGQVLLITEVWVALGIARIDFLDILLLLRGVDHILVLPDRAGLFVPYWRAWQRYWLLLGYLSCWF